MGGREKHLLPGPPTLPVVGNISQISLKHSHFKFTEWTRQYGGIDSLKLGTGTAVVITDRRLVKELVDKKSSKYTTRPDSYVANLIGDGDHHLLTKYGPQETAEGYCMVNSTRSWLRSDISSYRKLNAVK